jgi:hypothetical protein
MSRFDNFASDRALCESDARSTAAWTPPRSLISRSYGAIRAPMRPWGRIACAISRAVRRRAGEEAHIEDILDCP